MSLALQLASFYLRHSPLERGRWRLLRWGIPASKLLLRNGYRTIRTRYGFRLRVDLGDFVGRHVYVTGEFESSTSRVMKELLKPGDTVVDIGAHIGYFTLLAARCVGSSGKVFAFEPMPRTRKQLVRNLQLNKVTNAFVREEAVRDRAGETTFYEGPPNNLGLSSLRPLEGSSRILRVRTGRLDDLLPPGQKVSFVKLDVEGAEFQVLEGMSRYLQRDRPDLIVEITDHFLRALGHSPESLCTKLIGFGYRMYAIDYDALVPLSCWSPNLPQQFNALFTHRSQLPSSLRTKQEWHG